jgi:methylenetetrahydrofolate reductase (NADPH)
VSVELSFEVFPPRTADGIPALAETAARLAAANPAFVSVTYGAGGARRDLSYDAIRAVRQAADHHIAGHLTCVGQSRSDIDDVVRVYRSLGVDRIVALRGDPPAGVDAPYEPHPDGYQSTADLVAAIRSISAADVAVAAYPERHPQSPSDAHDLDVLAAKVAAGADRAITQMFFDNEHYLRFRDRVAARGINIPIVPGILPIHSLPAITTFAQRCGATIPATVVSRFDGVDTKHSAHAIATEIASEQIFGLVDEGVQHVHIYTLNRADLALDVCEQLGWFGDVPSEVRDDRAS